MPPEEQKPSSLAQRFRDVLIDSFGVEFPAYSKVRRSLLLSPSLICSSLCSTFSLLLQNINRFYGNKKVKKRGNVDEINRNVRLRTCHVSNDNYYFEFFWVKYRLIVIWHFSLLGPEKRAAELILTLLRKRRNCAPESGHPPFTVRRCWRLFCHVLRHVACDQ